MKKITLTADIIIENDDDTIVLAERGNPPFKGIMGLPGGKMKDEGETIEETAIREAKEETNLDIELTGIVGVYSQPGRDPRGRYISVTFTAKVVGGKLKPGSDAAKVITTSDYNSMELAFDHNQILKDYMRQRNEKIKAQGTRY